MKVSAEHLAPAPTANGRVRVKPSGPAFTDAVLRDLLRISKTGIGRRVFRRVRDAGLTITIEKPDPPPDPPNAWTRPRYATARGCTEIVVVYHPADWPSPAHAGSPPSDAVLFGRLEDALAMANAAAQPSASEHAAAPALETYLRERTVIPA